MASCVLATPLTRRFDLFPFPGLWVGLWEEEEEDANARRRAMEEAGSGSLLLGVLGSVVVVACVGHLVQRNK